MIDEAPLLEIHNLKTHFITRGGISRAVDGISWSLKGRETIGIVGESGCGKTVSALSVLRLIPDPPGKIVDGTILFEGDDLLQMDQASMREIRGNKISMIFQEPMTSLNPVFTIGNQIAETIRLHQRLRTREALEKCVEMLGRVRIPSPKKNIHAYPYQLSGGMRQRAMIAMSLSCNPRILIADEPTTALDVTIQAQILDLLNQLKEEVGTALVIITHNLGVIAEMAERVLVMYAGKVVEEAPVDEIFHHAGHPYTQGLLRTLPRIDREIQPGKKLFEIPGMIPNLYKLPQGCYYHPRCSHVMDECRREDPGLRRVGADHLCRCWLVESKT